ncbi:MAG: bifunctional biotin--[acetyl-CoA-carboxylase] ligase/biotin operon repressor BirA [Gammaproteobacteria bacterium]|nr:bifunctional biotin--[acetyl-CoA-carboxylase] ligase/biotin operon repressor BirA [Gammaproteobacteria bacterium]MDH5651234.1 bifunctional biotin--[acetyl-CoA-carboxylase] ligase/biotin operon repressor BirA [Gammaproteobacteria bacterium]
MPEQLKVLALLSDGKFHSGRDLGEQLGVSRAAVWKTVQGIEEQLGVTVQSVPGRGYRLARPLELLTVEGIQTGLSSAGRALLSKIEVLPCIDSTNNYLRNGAVRSGQVVFAEQQTAGRGRRGNRWVSPFGKNLYFSLAWRFDVPVMQLSGLGLVVAIAVANGLAVFVPDVGLKWPNDIYWQNRKLAGILLEVEGEVHGTGTVIIGIGININMTPETGAAIDQPWVDLSTIAGAPVSRSRVAGIVLDAVLSSIRRYTDLGFSPFREAWLERDILYGQAVNVLTERGKICGIGRGIDQNGAILVEQDGELLSYHAGEVSLRRRD